MIKKGFFVLLMIIVTIGKGHAQEWNQDNLKTSVTFKIKNFGVQPLKRIWVEELVGEWVKS